MYICSEDEVQRYFFFFIKSANHTYKHMLHKMTPRVYTAISVEKVRDIALVCLPAGAVSKLEMITHWGLYGIERCKFVLHYE